MTQGRTAIPDLRPADLTFRDGWLISKRATTGAVIGGIFSGMMLLIQIGAESVASGDSLIAFWVSLSSMARVVALCLPFIFMPGMVADILASLARFLSSNASLLKGSRLLQRVLAGAAIVASAALISSAPYAFYPLLLAFLGATGAYEDIKRARTKAAGQALHELDHDVWESR